MVWRDELRLALIAAAQEKTSPLAAVESIDDQQRGELLRRTLTVASGVFKFAQTELFQVGIPATIDGNTLRRLFAIDDHFLEVALIMNDTAMKVRRENGVIDLLHVENGSVIDGTRTPLSSTTAYFGRRVLELVRSSRKQRP